jgi:hypothetical protein
MKERGIGISDLVIARVGGHIGEKQAFGQQRIETTLWLESV